MPVCSSASARVTLRASREGIGILAQRSNDNLRRNEAVTNGGEGISDDEWKGMRETSITNEGDDNDDDE